MSEIDLKRIALLIGKEEPSLFKDYVDRIANRALLPYKLIFQYGKKRGESLYIHVLNGIFVLETLRILLQVSDEEARMLFTAFTVHDLNKVLKQPKAFGKLATRENVSAEIERLNLDTFFPDWHDYSEDITSLVRGHPGHAQAGGERWVVKRESRYKLGLDRINALLHLMRAADIVDLSHTLEERARKADFLGYLNAYLADSDQGIQYRFFIHQLTEQRGLLTNVLHNAIAADLKEYHHLLPLLYYPEGIAYLGEKKSTVQIGPDDRARMARRIAATLSEMISGKFREFIHSGGQGIKVDAKCLGLGVSFRQIWREIYNKVQRRNFPPDLDSKARERAQRNFDRSRATSPEAAEEVQAVLAGPASVVSTNVELLRLGELLRTYYIFLKTHFSTGVADPWTHIYKLLELPTEKWPLYAYFEARYDRAYVLARDLSLLEEEVYRRIEADGQAFMANIGTGNAPKIALSTEYLRALFTEYLSRYAVFGTDERPQVGFGDHLAHYIAAQHKQCVYCSSPFPTDKWMTADVRSDIKVQVFSNRLRGGPGEPKKHICAICQIQFLLEKLNYPEIRGEKTLYLHLYPYTFLTGPFIEGLKATIRRITAEDTAVRALNLDSPSAIQAYGAQESTGPTFRSRTQKNKPQPYGLYLPRYAETVGNLLVFPINPAGKNDTERWLFALWNALVLQRHFGVKVLLSHAAVPPLGKEDFADLYVENIPLACRGLLPHNDYAQFRNGSAERGTLPTLWDDVSHLFALRQLTLAVQQDHTPQLVRALAAKPLSIFYQTERLLEAKARGESGGLITWLSQQAFPHVQALALSKGGVLVAILSEKLQQLAKIAWQQGLRGRSLERNSLLFPLDEVLQKLGQGGRVADAETLRAAAAQDIFDHLYRIADERYKPGKNKAEAAKSFVQSWFAGVVKGVYAGNVRKLLDDEKLIRSAFLFYVREQIPHQAAKVAEADHSDEGA